MERPMDVCITVISCNFFPVFFVVFLVFSMRSIFYTSGHVSQCHQWCFWSCYSMTLVMLVYMTTHREFVGPGYGDWVLCNNHHHQLSLLFFIISAQHFCMWGHISACYQWCCGSWTAPASLMPWRNMTYTCKFWLHGRGCLSISSTRTHPLPGVFPWLCGAV